MDKNRVNLSCPFTWEMDKVLGNRNNLLETRDDGLRMVQDKQDDFPESCLMYYLMLSYEYTMNNDLQNAMQQIEEADKAIAEIKQKAALKTAERTLDHILVATKCHILDKMGQSTKIDVLLKGICLVRAMNETEMAMLNACQCLAWSFYYLTDNLKAINYAQKAIEFEPHNGKWYYLLGKNYRRLRRMHKTSCQLPDEREARAHKTAYELSKNNILFAVSLAQFYRESKNQDTANKIYEEVYALQPTSCSVRLRLAMGFIRAKKCALAKNCLEYVERIMPDSVMYTHYMGIYEEECNKNHKAALPYYKSSTEKVNFGAEWQYVRCRKSVEPNWDPLPYLLNLLQKYGKDSDRNLQDMNIQIGLYYLLEMNDVQRGCQYLTKAIEIEPNSQQVKVNYPSFRPSQRVNVYNVLRQKVQTASRTASGIDPNTKAMYEEALKLCRENSYK